MMETIESVAKRDVKRMMVSIFCVCALLASALFYAMHPLRMEREGEFLIFGVIFLESLFIPRAARIAKLRKVERAQWLEAYGASPESHLLHLND
jgi:hypothetical protein